MTTPTDLEALAAKLTKAESEFLFRLQRGYELKLADRHEDRARQKCRRAGLTSWNGKPKQWHLTPLGLSLRTHLERTTDEK